MEIADELICMFNAQVVERNDSYMIEVPKREVNLGTVRNNRSYRVAFLPTVSEPGRETGANASGPTRRRRTNREPPVDEGDRIEVEIEDVGDQGDGLARIGPGYIVFVPETEVGDRVTVEVAEVRENFAFGNVIEG